jgi:hypothetical protein
MAALRTERGYTPSIRDELYGAKNKSFGHFPGAVFR